MMETNTLLTEDLDYPKNMILSEKSDSLAFEYSLFKPKYFLSLFAAPIFTYFLIMSEFVPGDFSKITLSVFILLGLCLYVIYYSLAKLLNTGKIEVNRQEITVRTGPIPMGGNLILNKNDVKQLYVTRRRTGHRYYLASTTYQVNVILADKEVITLVKNLETSKQARFIENKIEDFLHIKDVHVAGELAKD